MMTVFIILLLIVLNGLFVAAEFALLGAPRAALEQMGVSGNMVARRVSQILKTPRLQDRYIATAQLGVTFAHSSSFVPLSGRPIRAIRRSQPRGLPGVA